ncbi:MAG: response regulator transcription factor [Dehalococcoidia bacterium]
MVTTTQTLTAPGGQVMDSLLSMLHINGAVVVRPRQTDGVSLNAEPLTDRELQVLSLVAEGCSNKMIGDRLMIRERTVKNHLTCIMTKLRASDRTHAVVTAIRLGWLAI